MGSLPTMPQPVLPPPPPPSSPESSLNSYTIYASFCHDNVSNWIECYNSSTNVWSYVTSIPGLMDDHVLRNFSMISLGDSVYVIGGILCHRKRIIHNSDKFVDKDVEVRSSVLRYDIRSDRWFECAQLVVSRYDFACVVSEGKIYVAGGKSSLASARGISSAEVYDPVNDTWTPLPNMSTMRYKCVGVTWNGKIHVVGGFAVRGDSDVTGPFMPERSSVEVYDTQAGKWDMVAGMWQLDVPPNQIVAVDGRLFSSGDCFKAWKGHIEAYDGKLNIWNVVDGSHLHTLNQPIATSEANNEDNWPPMPRLYLTMAPIGTHLYFLAGYRMTGELPRTMSVVHVFDTSASSDTWPWTSFEPMEEEGEKELCSHCCVVKVS